MARTFEQLLAAYPSHVQQLAQETRALVRELLPSVQESVDTSGPYVHYGYGSGYAAIVCYLSISKSGVKLGVANGATLADPKGLLHGEGKLHRHVPLEEPSDLRQPGLKPLIRAGLAAWRTRKRRRRTTEIAE